MEELGWIQTLLLHKQPLYLQTKAPYFGIKLNLFSEKQKRNMKSHINLKITCLNFKKFSPADQKLPKLVFVDITLLSYLWTWQKVSLSASTLYLANNANRHYRDASLCLPIKNELVPWDHADFLITVRIISKVIKPCRLLGVSSITLKLFTAAIGKISGTWSIYFSILRTEAALAILTQQPRV